MIDIRQGDCLELLKTLPNNSIDMVLTDPPYGITACKWDNVIPFEPMWTELKRVVKDNGAICLFGSEPFSSHLRLSNIKMFKYDWIWKKNQGSNPLMAKKQPLNNIEYVSVFYAKQCKYIPQFSKGKPYHTTRDKSGRVCEINQHTFRQTTTINDGWRYPTRIIDFKKQTGFHPTQKPTDLLEYLIKTYTHENETVLDFTMGSGSTGIACLNTNRKFIGFELDEHYFDIAKERIEKHLGE